MGLELQIEELQEQCQRAKVQDRPEDARRIEAEIRELQAELAATAEMLSARPGNPDPPPEMHDAAKLMESET